MILERLKQHRHKFAVALLLLVPVLMLLFGQGGEVVTSDPSSLDSAASQVVGAGQRAGARAGGSLRGWLIELLGGDDIHDVGLLRQENQRLEEEKARLIGILQENARLRELVGFKQQHSQYEVIPAQVVAMDTTPYLRVLRLHIRSERPVKPRSPVVVAGGVVGQIHKVHGDYAEVILLSDPRSNIDVISQRNRAHGLVQGLGHERDYLARVAYLDERDVIKPGDIMVTSGMGLVFPKELVVGRVVDVQRDDQDMFQNAVLKPAVDLSRLEEVFVVDMPTQQLPETDRDAP